VGPLAAEISRAFPREAHAVADAKAAAELLEGLLHGRDTVLVKGSRGVGLEQTVATLRAGGVRPGHEYARDASVIAPGAGAGPR
jgi:UDP-N-acetylmuramyl pentapeptide synthase